MVPAAGATVGDLDRYLCDLYPHEWAEPWDRVGLLAGDPSEPIRGIYVTLDADESAVARAVEAGANVLLTHHPAFLEPPGRLSPAPGASATVYSAVRSGVSLICAHTNLDRAPEAGLLLPQRLDLEVIGPIESSGQPMTTIDVFVPAEAVEDVAEAMMRAGAGRIGQYRSCRFDSAGEGHFVPDATATPTVGTAGTPSAAAEVQIRTVCSSANAERVVAAARQAHPYEEPLVIATPCTIARGAARLGMLCEPVWECGEGCVLQDLAAIASWKLGVTPRVWGDPERPLTRVATATGSGGSVIADAMAAGADALLTGEVRYHDARAAVAAGLGIVEVGHDVSEWPLVNLLAAAARSVPGIAADRIIVEQASASWWTP